MGQLLQSYLAANLPALQAIVEEDKPKPSMPGGIPQPGGATTFPMPQEQPMPMQPIGPGGQPTGPMGVMPPPGAINPAAAATPTFDGAPTPGAEPQPAMPPVEAQAQDDKSAEFEDGPDSFATLAKDAPEEDKEKAVKVMEDQGVDIEAEHAKIVGDTGEGKGKGLSKQEKALILMEFGLNLMASSGTGEGTFASDIGQAGGAALTGHMGRKAARQKMLSEAEDKKLERELKQAQIDKARKAKTTIKTVGGKLVSINEDTREASPILMDGEPVDAENVDKYASEVDRQAYETVVCEGLTGSEMKACKRRALAYSKGGAAKVAFPELELADQRENVMDLLQDPDNRSSKYPVASAGGQHIRWKDMTEGQRMETRDTLVAQRTKEPNITTKEGGGGGGIEGLSQEDIAKMKPGKIYGLSDGREVKLVDGVPQIVD